MSDKSFAISITGKGISPDTLRLRDLYDILRGFEAAVAFIASQGGSSIETNFHLVGIKKGSADCLMSVDSETYGATVRCASAVARRDLSELPEKARDSLLAIRAKAKTRDWSIHLSDGNGMPSAEISPNTEFVTDAIISGPSSIAARLLRVGGVRKPTANLMLLDGRKFTASVASEQLASRLGAMLYHIVSVEGEAKWTIADWSLVDFKITGIGEYDDNEPITRVLDDMASIAGNFWDDTDPDEYIANLRAESE